MTDTSPLAMAISPATVADLHADEEHRGFAALPLPDHHRSVERFREARGGGINSIFPKCQAWRLRSRSPT